MDKVIYCIRHGQTDYNKNGIVQGSGVDSDLNDLGMIQAEQFYHHYRNEVHFDLIIHSALKRTKQTISPWIKNGPVIIADKRIDEMSWGDAEGQKGTNESVVLYKRIVDEWSRGNLDVGIHNGETAQELKKRLSSFVNELKERKEKTILLCSHGRAMRGLLCALQEEPYSEMESYKISNVGLYKVIQKGKSFEILSQNDISHRTPLTHS